MFPVSSTRAARRCVPPRSTAKTTRGLTAFAESLMRLADRGALISALCNHNTGAWFNVGQPGPSGPVQIPNHDSACCTGEHYEEKYPGPGTKDEFTYAKQCGVNKDDAENPVHKIGPNLAPAFRYPGRSRHWPPPGAGRMDVAIKSDQFVHRLRLGCKSGNKPDNCSDPDSDEYLLRETERSSRVKNSKLPYAERDDKR